MPLTFYPPIKTGHPGKIEDRIDVLTNAAEEYKAAVLDGAGKPVLKDGNSLAPKDLLLAYNWEEISEVLQIIREMPEVNKEDREIKVAYLDKLVEIYEVLRAAKMSKLEAVRLALASEANSLKGGDTSQVA